MIIRSHLIDFSQLMETEECSRLLFGRHQGYDLREQWITKGLLALTHTEDPQARARLFSVPAAFDSFGIGPGMIVALRYWLRATGLMVELSGTGQGRKVPTLTPFGALLAQHDPHLERIGSLWLLHAHLAQNLRLAPTFYWFFHYVVRNTSFTKETCLEMLQRWAIQDAPHQQAKLERLCKDIECLLRLYSGAPVSSQMTPEQPVLASPFHRLHLLRCLPPEADAGASAEQRMPQYHFTPQPGAIPELVVLALLLENNQGRTRVPLIQVLHRHQQPGRCCDLTQTTLIDAFHRLDPAWAPQHVWMQQQLWLTLPVVTVEQVLLRYYAQP